MTPFDTALLAAREGLSAVPPKEDGSKTPIESWKKYQITPADETQIRKWYQNGRQGVGLICGAVSGGLEMFEFEGLAVRDGIQDRFKRLAEEAGLGDVLARIRNGYVEKTPSGGVHLLWRCTEVDGNLKLAERVTDDGEIKVLIETRGEGGFTIIAPSSGSVHETGKPYVLVRGGLSTIPTITPSERREILNIARSLDEMPGKPKDSYNWTQATGGGDRPGDDYNARTTGADVVALLERHEWVSVYRLGDRTLMRRPGKDIGVSATVFDTGVFVCFTTSTRFEGYNKKGREGVYSPFAVYTILEHGGDWSGAARALRPKTSTGGAERGTPTPDDPPEEPYTPTQPLAELLDQISVFLSRFIVFPNEHGVVAVTLWIAYTHAVDQFDVAPHILVTAPEIESGKTKTLEVAATLCHKPRFSSSMTPAVLFRTVDKDHPTLFLDEADNIWTGRNDEKAGELVSLLNSGHRRGIPATRMGGPNKTTLEEFDVFGPKAIAGAFPDVGAIPEALRSRSVHLRMKRKLPDEVIERWTRQKRLSLQGMIDELRRALAGTLAASDLTAIHVEVLDDLSDRDFDIWEPLLAIAQLAGGDWPQMAVKAAITLCAEDDQQATPLRLLLLQDLGELRELGELWGEGHDHELTVDILDRLHKMPERPWGDYYGSPITAHKLGRILSSYGIKSKFDLSPERRKGYYRQDLEDLWARYSPQSSQSSQSSQTSQPGEETSGGPPPDESVDERSPCADCGFDGDPPGHFATCPIWKMREATTEEIAP